MPFRYMWCFSERGGRQGDLEQQRQPAGSPEEASESADRLHWPSARPAGAQFWAAEVPERAGQNGAGSISQPDRHAGQNLVPEQEVSMWAAGNRNKRTHPRNIQIIIIIRLISMSRSFSRIDENVLLGYTGLSYHIIFPLIVESPAKNNNACQVTSLLQFCSTKTKGNAAELISTFLTFKSNILILTFSCLKRL